MTLALGIYALAGGVALFRLIRYALHGERHSNGGL